MSYLGKDFSGELPELISALLERHAHNNKKTNERISIEYCEMDVIRHCYISENNEVNMIAAAKCLTPRALNIFRKVIERIFCMKLRSFLMVLILFFTQEIVIALK